MDVFTFIGGSQEEQQQQHEREEKKNTQISDCLKI